MAAKGSDRTEFVYVPAAAEGSTLEPTLEEIRPEHRFAEFENGACFGHPDLRVSESTSEVLAEVDFRPRAFAAFQRLMRPIADVLLLPMDNAAMPRELFRFDNAASVAGFSAIDDRVMGGRSASRLRHDPAGHAVFEGEVSLADGGGFASVRSRSLPSGDAQSVTCVIEVLGDGKRYKLNLCTDDLFDGVTYQATFEPVSGEWSVLRLPLASFKPTWRGRPIDGVSEIRPENLRQVGLVIGDRQVGRFALALRCIALE